MDLKSIFKQALPFVVGLLIGAGFSKNKYVWYILISYFVMMMVFDLLKNKIMKVKKSDNKVNAIKHETMESVKDVGEMTLKGNQIGSRLFDKFYSNYIFFINLAMFIGFIILLAYGEWMWSLICFIGMNFQMSLNQILRMVKEVNNGNIQK